MHCYLCSGKVKHLYEKASRHGKNYPIYRCLSCGLWQLDLSEQEKETLNALYDTSYFSQRKERGYDNYAGKLVEKSVLHTFEKNLKDLKLSFLLHEKGRYLEIGCAAGHILHYLKEKGWEVCGVDISPHMVAIAQSRGLKVYCADFLSLDLPESYFDVIAMWATIEHLPDPLAFVHKAKKHLKKEGHFLITTCHNGFFARIYGANWRYLNVPEHIYYFSKKSLKILFEKEGFALRRSITYGSGFTSREGASWSYRLAKKIFDKVAKLSMGDMIAMDFVLKTSDKLI
ncbi:MAG: class I SAM-dependent methyltransferase [Leptospiraceae bacterium]|nr:class I SAM-dependent methyltransferase [Leptospiraceae bacterium]MDW8306443.1 class I SAM-dependent methyltransferase [Leptospiraceae bacterium]